MGAWYDAFRTLRIQLGSLIATVGDNFVVTWYNANTFDRNNWVFFAKRGDDPGNVVKWIFIHNSLVVSDAATPPTGSVAIGAPDVPGPYTLYFCRNKSWDCVNRLDVIVQPASATTTIPTTTTKPTTTTTDPTTTTTTTTTTKPTTTTTTTTTTKPTTTTTTTTTTNPTTTTTTTTTTKPTTTTTTTTTTSAVSTPSPIGVPCSEIFWAGADIFATGTIVTFQNGNYKAKWTMQYEMPSPTNVWGGWEYLGACWSCRETIFDNNDNHYNHNQAYNHNHDHDYGCYNYNQAHNHNHNHDYQCNNH
ncbi:hypothetical protein BDR26DRAFT_352361 [Obelidium mucronatum]|nr:hypothetical protein BDR26DRAFT_352361 [Obelidium mucronatum]